jgi:Domain of Unknown Function (DUF748)
MLATSLASGPILKPWFVREANARLVGYTLQIGSVSFHPWSLSLIFRGLNFRQSTHPDPAIVSIPRLTFDVQWLALLRGRIVATALIDSPALSLNVAQLDAEVNDPVTLRQHGWQRLPELYPLQINLVTVRDATLVYTAEDVEHPLQLREVQLEIRNIRHVEASGARYPSPVRASALVFDSGKASFEGAADFLRYARPAFRGNLQIDSAPLATLGPVLKQYPLAIKGGTLAAQGEVESNPDGTQAHLAYVRIDGLHADYLGGSDPAAQEAGRRAVHAVGRAARDPGVQLLLDDLQLRGELGFVNLARSPRYRLYIGDATVALSNVSNHDSRIESRLSLNGLLMGAGRTSVKGVFRSGTGRPDFALDIRSIGTPLTRLNDMLRAHARLDVVQGTFSVYAQMQASNGKIRGYVKPLFDDVRIYDAGQDGNKNPFQQFYELVSDGIRKVLENHKRQEVATVADLSGNISEPNTSTLQVIGNLLRNAFVQAIVPGFDRRIHHRGARDTSPDQSRPAHQSSTPR